METELTGSRSLLFLSALRAAFGRAPLWLISWFVPFLAAGVIALPWVDWFADTAAHSYEPKGVIATMDETFRFDHGDALSALGRGGAQRAAGLAFFLMMFGAFTAGGWLQVFLERTSGHSVRRFLWGGARYFWRFFRVWILTLLALSLATWLTHGWVWKHVVLDMVFGATDGDLEVLDSELSAVWLGWLQAGSYACLFALVLVWGDYTRTRMALHNSRSAIWAGMCTVGLILRRPVKVLRPFVLILLVELGVLSLLGSYSWSTNAELGPESTWKTILLLFALGQLALMWQTISRAARYYAAVQVSRRLVPPLSKPDPWGKHVGGPGGPQYPLDDADDYNISY